MYKITLIALAGAAGTLSRYFLSGLAQRLAGAGFPLGTFAVNMLGCLFFGTVWGIFEDRLALSGEARTIILTGFMGAFTTFSTFIFETQGLAQSGQIPLALANVLGQCSLGLVLAWLGLALGRLI